MKRRLHVGVQTRNQKRHRSEAEHKARQSIESSPVNHHIYQEYYPFPDIHVSIYHLWLNRRKLFKANTPQEFRSIINTFMIELKNDPDSGWCSDMPFYITMRQAHQLGWKMTRRIFSQMKLQSNGTKVYPYECFAPYSIQAVEQIATKWLQLNRQATTRDPNVETFIDQVCRRHGITLRRNIAVVWPCETGGKILMPSHKLFKSRIDYYSTLFHEMGHALCGILHYSYERNHEEVLVECFAAALSEYLWHNKDSERIRAAARLYLIRNYRSEFFTTNWQNTWQRVNTMLNMIY